MNRNRIGRLAMVLVACLVLSAGCRTATKDRLRYLEAENAKLSAENSSMKGDLAAERNARLMDQEERAKADERERAAQARVDALIRRDRDRNLDALGKERGVDVDGDQIRMSSDITFQPGKATLTRGAEKILARIAATIKEQPFGRISIEGHTDSDPIRKSGWASNEELSMERAKSVRDALAHHGIQRSMMEVKGFGASEPIDPGTTKAAKAKNRRVVIRVSDG